MRKQLISFAQVIKLLLTYQIQGFFYPYPLRRPLNTRVAEE